MTEFRDIHKAMVEGSLRHQADMEQDRQARGREAAKGGFAIGLLGIGALFVIAVAAIALLLSLSGFLARFA